MAILASGGGQRNFGVFREPVGSTIKVHPWPLQTFSFLDQTSGKLAEASGADSVKVHFDDQRGQSGDVMVDNFDNTITVAGNTYEYSSDKGWQLTSGNKDDKSAVRVDDQNNSRVLKLQMGNTAINVQGKENDDFEVAVFTQATMHVDGDFMNRAGRDTPIRSVTRVFADTKEGGTEGKLTVKAGSGEGKDLDEADSDQYTYYPRKQNALEKGLDSVTEKIGSFFKGLF